MSDLLIKQVAKLVTKRLLTWLATKAAFISFGPINFILSILLEKLLTKALELTFLGAMLAYIAIDTKRDLNAVEKLIKEINENKGELTDDKIKEYDEKLAKAGRELIRFGTIS